MSEKCRLCNDDKWFRDGDHLHACPLCKDARIASLEAQLADGKVKGLSRSFDAVLARAKSAEAALAVERAGAKVSGDIIAGLEAALAEAREQAGKWREAAELYRAGVHSVYGGPSPRLDKWQKDLDALLDGTALPATEPKPEQPPCCVCGKGPFKDVAEYMAHGCRHSDPKAVPMVLYCPAGHQHLDEGEWATKPHKTHQCQVKVNSPRPDLQEVGYWDICGLEWRPANFPTVGVEKLP